LFNVFSIDTPTTMTAPGGQMVSAAGSYQGDGRLHMARELERRWPGVVTIHRKFGRPQHRVKDNWQRFDTPLRRRPDVVVDPRPNNYGLELVAVRPPKAPALQELLAKEGRR
jgi:hypothetical protein